MVEILSECVKCIEQAETNKLQKEEPLLYTIVQDT